MTPEQESSINVLTLEVRRLNARLNDTIQLLYNLENRLMAKLEHRLRASESTQMPRGLNTGEFSVVHGKNGRSELKKGGGKT